LPFFTRISDSDNYLHAVGRGLGVYEIADAAGERSKLAPILEWVNLPIRSVPESRPGTEPADRGGSTTPATVTRDERKVPGISIFPRFKSYLRPTRQDSIPESLRAKSNEVVG